MVGTRAVTSNKLTTSLRFELIGRPVGRLQALATRTDTVEVAGVTSRSREADARQQVLEQYRELAATPVRWVRLT